MTASTSLPRVVAHKSVRKLLSDVARQCELLDGLKLLSAEELTEPQASTAPVVFVSFLDDLDAQSTHQLRRAKAPRKRYMLLQRDLPIEAVAEKLALLDVRSPRRVHIARTDNDARTRRVLERLLVSVSQGDPTDTRILDAWCEDDSLVVLDVAFERLRVGLDQLRIVRPLRKLSNKRIRKFEIQRDGAHLLWPEVDVHLGWDQLARLADPTRHVSRQPDAFDARYGAAIRRVREDHGLTQSQIADLTPRHLRRIEHGKQRITHAAIQSLAAAHGMSLADYLATIADALSAETAETSSP